MKDRPSASLSGPLWVEPREAENDHLSAQDACSTKTSTSWANLDKLATPAGCYSNPHLGPGPVQPRPAPWLGWSGGSPGESRFVFPPGGSLLKGPCSRERPPPPPSSPASAAAAPPTPSPSSPTKPPTREATARICRLHRTALTPPGRDTARLLRRPRRAPTSRPAPSRVPHPLSPAQRHAPSRHAPLRRSVAPSRPAPPLRARHSRATPPRRTPRPVARGSRAGPEP